MDYQVRLKSLNPEQLAAVNYIDGPLVVRAGPGTGKTQIITMRIENILHKTDVLPENILCLTFTESAAENMRQRLYAAIGKPSRKVNFYTFHGFGRHLISKLNDYSDQTNLTRPIEEIIVFEIIEQLLEKLDHNNPLSRRTDDGFYYIKYITTVFQWLKKSGLTSNTVLEDIDQSEQFFKLSTQALTDALSDRTSKKRLPDYQLLFSKLKSFHQKHPSKAGNQSLVELATAIDEITIDDSSKPITAWKSKWTSRNSKNQLIYLDQRNLSKFKATIQLLDKYQAKLDSMGYYDYDDMILKASNALRTNQDFKLNVQEQYQYILVDEYQDTNGAQNQLLELLCDNPVYEGSPDLMVVGDPDQAIFSFQGADSSLLTDFSNKWNNCQQITLINNYRSGQELLDFSKSVLDNANDNDQAISLVAGTKNNHTDIFSVKTDTASQSYYQVGLKITELIKTGVEPKDISIISKQHSQLSKVLPFLTKLEIPFSYERDSNILDQPKIAEIIDLMNLIQAMASESTHEINALLAKVLSAGYWGLSTDLWWNIALSSKRNYQQWTEVIENHNDQYLIKIWQSFKQIAKLSLNNPFELIFNYLIGSKAIELDNDEIFYLPWLSYHFKQKNSVIENDLIVFINQFNKLKYFFTNWLNYSGENIKLVDFIKFIKLINKDYIQLVDHSTTTSIANAVAVTTAYKAKGEEWNHVFILDCNNKLWAKTRGNNLGQFVLPTAYQFIEPASFLAENIVKPFYVSITRARKSLYLNNYEIDDRGISTEDLDWIDQSMIKTVKIPNSNKAEIISFLNQDWQTTLLTRKNDYKEAMTPILDNFKLSATHLNNFLEIGNNNVNNFIFHNLLGVPQVVKPKLIYGTAMHEAISYLHKINSNDKRIIPLKELINYFNDQLKNSPLTSKELIFYQQKANLELSAWYKYHLTDFSAKDVSEYKISQTYLDADIEKLTGKIDLLKFNSDGTLCIVDYKSSAPPAIYSKLNREPKGYRYKRQLLFYKILLESINYQIGSKPIKINNGVIEFLTPDESGQIITHLIEFEDQDIERIKLLVKIVWQKIINLDIIDTSKYDNSLKGMIQLEDDLIAGKI
ncbi:MAG TPA: ATP-dependent DNA helicase [Candidatus Dormibacteraeota bacterium]|nr:ATP-dependent DNA helicase [Candidatus Dormibacteraeota bacterium]